MDKYFLDTPIGYLHLIATEDALVELSYVKHKTRQHPAKPSSGIIDKTVQQLSEYFNGERKEFSLPLAPEGTDFQMEVWKQLQEIPYGSTTTYSKLSQKMENPKAIRAIGRANGQNPIPIIIPCHRVIGANDKLVGYAGGIETKRWLLQHEGALLL
ncbi:methylated-DNA--[protein]-cysteine S-methyltransferase [Balneolaceae bacterium YR4-1]|uniref:Methylated-DNA--protein-cysteine methyltransferase n=1 Tax=Halalkalibaculum roseum TaxID=2709311 RepID=A0A6M1SL45_9BACT|nr:methylated-DNA--[protein]-cysteine S-methyltransferase [Halalkalibaculum roseum]NGP76041.1 methylated-DNA--[protein]-cysteine S-methyltransferase [Halalkalibaculum roseum]